MFTAENELEKLLLAAALAPDDGNAIESFYRAFLDADIYVIGQVDGPLDEDGHLRANSSISVQQFQTEDGRVVIPMFSSPRRISDYADEETAYIGVNTRSLLEMIEGSDAMLNPGSDYGKELLAGEIAALLNGTVFSQLEQIEVRRETTMRIGQPKDYPHALVNALRALFVRMPTVHAAYLAHCVIPEADDQPHTVIGVAGADDLSEVIRRAGRVAQKHLARGDYVDFVRIEESTLSDYMVNQTEPFYRRRQDA